MPFKYDDRKAPDGSQPKTPDKSKTPNPDWAPRRGPASPIIRLEPAAETRSMRLGETLRQRYSVDEGRDVAWTHSIDGRLLSNRTGLASAVDVQATDDGERALQAAVTIDGTKHRGPEIKLVAPKSRVEVVGLFGRAERGTFPISSSIQLGEDLVVHVHLPYTDEAIDKVAARFSGSMRVKQTTNIGAQKFEVVLVPTADVEKSVESTKRASVKGELSVTPAKVGEHAIRPTELAIEVLPRAANAFDFGERPKDTKDAVGRVTRGWASLYERRITGLHTLLTQIAEKDPIPPPPMFESILTAAATIALSAATAGIGQALVTGLKTATRLQAGRTEATKSMIESSLSSIVQGVAAGLSAAQTSPATLRTPGGTLLNVRGYFLLTQEHALNASKLDHVDRVTTSMAALAEQLEHSQPGSGYRAAVAATEVIAAELKNAEDLQYVECLQAWCRLQAQLALGLGKREHGRDGGTELGSHIDADKMLRPRPKGDLGLDKTPGLLRLELGTPVGSEKGLHVKRALVEGFDNDAIVAGLHRPVRDLRIPMVAVYRPSMADASKPRQGFVVSRNENGAYLADSAGGALQHMFDGMSDHEAARHIFEHQIANQVLTVKRG